MINRAQFWHMMQQPRTGRDIEDYITSMDHVLAALDNLDTTTMENFSTMLAKPGEVPKSVRRISTREGVRRRYACPSGVRAIVQPPQEG